MSFPTTPQVALPYFADGFSIEMARELLDEAKRSDVIRPGKDKRPFAKWDCGVYLVQERYIVKIADKRAVKEGWLGNEVDNLVFLGRNAHGIAPHLYAAWVDSLPEAEQDLFCVVMEYIPGEPLDDVWDFLNHEDKQQVFVSLRRSLNAIAALLPPCDDVPYPGPPIPWPEQLCKILQARRSVGLLHRHVNRADDLFRTSRSQSAWDYAPRARGHDSDYANQLVSSHLENRLPLRFSHLDLNWQNILVHESPDGQFHARLIDWTYSGWFPDWAEYAMAVVELPVEVREEYLPIALGAHDLEALLLWTLSKPAVSLC